MMEEIRKLFHLKTNFFVCLIKTLIFMKKRHPRFCTYSTCIPNSDYDVTEYGLHLNESSCKFGCRINAKRTDKLN